MSVSTDDVEWIFCGKPKRCRPVMNAIASGTSEKRRKLARIRMLVLRRVVATIRRTPRFHPT